MRFGPLCLIFSVVADLSQYVTRYNEGASPFQMSVKESRSNPHYRQGILRLLVAEYGRSIQVVDGLFV